MSKARRIADSGRYNDAISIRDITGSALVERSTYGAGTDITPLINAAGDLLRTRGASTQRGKIIIPAGHWRMASGANDDSIAGHHIIGPGAQACSVYYDATTGVQFTFDGENTTVGWSGGGIGGIRCVLGAASLGGATPTCIQLDGVNVSGTIAEPDDFWMENVYINAETAATAYWYNGLFVFGNERTSPQGIRVGQIRDLQVFECSNIGIYFSNIVQWVMDNVGTYSGTGTGNNVFITGGGASNTNSTQVDIRLLTCSGELNVTNCSNVSIVGSCGSLVTSGADYIRGELNNSGTTSGTFGANSGIIVR